MRFFSYAFKSCQPKKLMGEQKKTISLWINIFVKWFFDETNVLVTKLAQTWVTLNIQQSTVAFLNTGIE